MPLRVAILSDDRLRAERWFRAVTSDPAIAATIVDAGRAVMRSVAHEVAIVDAALPDALTLCADLTARTGAQVLMANLNDHDDSALDALAAGARGIVYAAAPPAELSRALHVLERRQMWAPRDLIVAAWTKARTEIAKHTENGAALAQRLSTREREVFRYAAAGMGNKELANRLAISEATVKVHLTHIFQKLGVRGRGELAAAFHGILR